MIAIILQFLIKILQKWENRESLKLGGMQRNSQWSKVRNEFLKRNPYCAICKTKKSLQVHHCRPFHLFPEEELNPNNLITLCEDKNCHLRFGHLYSFKSFNPNIKEDAKVWKDKILNRP